MINIDCTVHDCCNIYLQYACRPLHVQNVGAERPASAQLSLSWRAFQRDNWLLWFNVGRRRGSGVRRSEVRSGFISCVSCWNSCLLNIYIYVLNEETLWQRLAVLYLGALTCLCSDWGHGPQESQDSACVLTHSLCTICCTRLEMLMFCNQEPLN